MLAHPFSLLGVPARCGAVRSAEHILHPSLPPSLPPYLSSSILHSFIPVCAWLPRALVHEQIEFSKWLLQAPERGQEGMNHI